MTLLLLRFTLCLLTLFVRWSTAVKEGKLRLVGGHSANEGNVEIYHAGLWGSICDDEWDKTEADIVCRTLGYNGSSRATYNSEFGRARRQIWMDNLYCQGGESSLSLCRFDGWGTHDCARSEAAGVECIKNNTAQPLVLYSDAPNPKRRLSLEEPEMEVRIVGGRNKMEGRVEVLLKEMNWSLVCGDGWSLLESTVVCQQLGLGYAQSAVQSSYFGGNSSKIAISGIKCTGDERHLNECLHDNIGQVFCPGKEENIAGVICATELPDLVPDEVELERSTYLEDRELFFLQCAMEENCLARTAYQMDRNDYGWQYERRRLLRFTARIGNIGTTDFRPFLPKYAWEWHMCHLHYHSMEVFAHFDIIDEQGRRVAEGHKASFCLEDNNCQPGIEKKYACANYGDQGISVGCSDTYLHNIDCQWIDITDLAPGAYYMKARDFTIYLFFIIGKKQLNSKECKHLYNKIQKITAKST
ncbi:lysyl oxidase homolog 2-like [Centruroides sculpturatus]|uniref:lysyl oxidase homolog 2-like n=1 Tax=Centruroides sculpturatus TaxID=218467 RepID=UPI000C6E903D|nr:lysyl oxidase homolog 2-like [Centruroides sculpturatus]